MVFPVPDVFVLKGEKLVAAFLLVPSDSCSDVLLLSGENEAPGLSVDGMPIGDGTSGSFLIRLPS